MPDDRDDELTTYHLLVHHPWDARVLVMVGAAGALSLPSVQHPADEWVPSEVDAFARKIHEDFGIRAFVLHEVTRDPPQVIEMEALDIHDGLEWAEIDSLAPEWQTPARKPIHALRAPWERRGFFAEATEWTIARLEELNIRPTSAPVQIKGAWAYSSVIRFPTSAGDIYFKAVSDSAANEPRLLKELEKRSPQNVPQVLVSDDHRRWMLMRDFGGTETNELADEHHPASVKQFAKIQIDSANHLATWRAAACADRTLPRFVQSIATFVEDPIVTKALNAQEQDRFNTIAVTYQSLCAELASFGLPDTLVNQDFRVGNIVWTGRDYVLYDWADSVIAHPFFSVTRFLNYIHDKPPLDAKARKAPMVDAYLNEWRDFLSLEKLREAFTIARRLNAMYQASRFHLAMQTSEPMIAWEQCIESQIRDVLINEGQSAS